MTTILKNLGLILASSFLLYASWPPSHFGPIVFIALIPLLYYLDSIKISRRLIKYFLLFSGILTSLFFFGFLTAYEAWGAYNNQSFIPILMCFVPLSVLLGLFGFFKKKSLGYLFLIFGWGTMELFQMNWDMNSPLLMLGNSLSYFPSMIQHYAVWGVTGGSMFIVAVNISIYLVIKKIIVKESYKKEVIILSSLMLVIVISIISFSIPREEHKTVRIGMGLLHFEHFTIENSQNPFLTISKYNKLVSKNKTDDVEAMFFPESAVVNSGWIENLNNKSLSNPLDSFCIGKDIFFGSHVFSIYDGDTANRAYNVNYDANSNLYYLKHNSAIFRSSLGRYSVKSKDKFVSFHEIKPYPSILGGLADLLNKEAVPLYLSPYNKSLQTPVKLSNGLKVYSIMCFESFFSDVIVKQNDADFIAVLANESWNYQDKGKEQYFSYMTPKAIESGKSLIKVANGGYSGYILSSGEVIEKIDYDNEKFVKLDIEKDREPSFYSIYFSQISSIIVIITISLLMYIIISFLKKFIN